MACKPRKNLKNILFKKRNKTFLEQINSTLILGNLFGCIFFSVKQESIYPNLILCLPIEILFSLSALQQIYHFNEQIYNTTGILRALDLLHLALMIGSAIIQPFYLIIRRNQHKQILLRMQELNKLMGLETKEYYRINYDFICSVTLISTLQISFLIVTYAVMHEKMKSILGRVAFKFLSFTCVCLNNYIIYLLRKEHQHQYSDINKGIVKLASEINPVQIRNAIKTARKLVKIYQMVTHSSKALSAFYTPLITLQLSIISLLLIRMSDAIFILEMLLRKGI